MDHVYCSWDQLLKEFTEQGGARAESLLVQDILGAEHRYSGLASENQYVV